MSFSSFAEDIGGFWAFRNDVPFVGGAIRLLWSFDIRPTIFLLFNTFEVFRFCIAVDVCVEIAETGGKVGNFSMEYIVHVLITIFNCFFYYIHIYLFSY